MRRILILSSLCILIFFGCQKESGTITIGENTSGGVVFVDSFMVTASTVLLDSLQTSASGYFLLGQLNDPDLGFIQSSSFAPLFIPDTYPEFQNSSQYDSVTLTLPYSKYAYGDTTQISGINVFQVTGDIKSLENKKYSDPDEQSIFVRNNVLYNNSSVEYSTSVLGTIRFMPRPHSKDSISITLDKDFGENLFNLIKSKDPRIRTRENFTNYFKGIALVTSQEGSHSVIGFNTDNAKLLLNYSEFNSAGIKQKKTIAFGIDSLLQFNSIQANRSSTVLSSLGKEKEELSSSDAGSRCFVAAGTAMGTKITFPGIVAFLNERINESVNVLNYAELVIEVPKPVNEHYTLPKDLVLYIANKKNKPQSILKEPYSGSEGADQYAVLQQNADGSGNIRYVFKFTEYINEMRKATSGDDNALILGIPPDRIASSVERLITGAPGNSKTKIKLNLIYTNIQL